MKKILFIAALALCTSNLRAADLDVTYNISIVSYANIQFSARNIFKGFGLHVNSRGLSNGTNVDLNNMHSTLDNMLSENYPYSVDITHNELESEIRRSGASFGLNKTLFKYLFVGAAAGYCDVVKFQETMLKPYEITFGKKEYLDEFYVFNDIGKIHKKFECEVMFGARPEYGKFYIPVYAGYSLNYSAFFGVGFGWKF